MRFILLYVFFKRPSQVKNKRVATYKMLLKRIKLFLISLVVPTMSVRCGCTYRMSPDVYEGGIVSLR